MPRVRTLRTHMLGRHTGGVVRPVHRHARVCGRPPDDRREPRPTRPLARRGVQPTGCAAAGECGSIRCERTDQRSHRHGPHTWFVAAGLLAAEGIVPGLRRPWSDGAERSDATSALLSRNKDVIGAVSISYRLQFVTPSLSRLYTKILYQTCITDFRAPLSGCNGR